MIKVKETKSWEGNCSAEYGGYCTVYGVPCWGIEEKPCAGYTVVKEEDKDERF